MRQQGFFVWRIGGKRMHQNDATQWVKVRLKTLVDLRFSWPQAWYWQNPFNPSPFPPADEVIIPFLGKTVWVRENRIDAFELFYEIKDSRGLIVLPEWIDHFLPDDSVPPSGWQDPKRSETWLELLEDRTLIVEDNLIIHG
jgi:hypothetical protein